MAGAGRRRSRTPRRRAARGRRVSRSMSTEHSGTRGSLVRAPVINSTSTSACNWSNVRPSSSGSARSAATAASNTAATLASASGSSSRWVWHMPVTLSTHRFTLRRAFWSCSRVVPAWRVRIRSRSRISRSNTSTTDRVADPTIADSRSRNSARPASSSRPASRATASTCPDDTAPDARRVEQARQVRTHRPTPGRVTGGPPRPASPVGQHDRGRIAGTVGGQDIGPHGDAGFVAVEPSTHLLRGRDEVGECCLIAGGRVGGGQHGDQSDDIDCDHAPSLRTYVRDVKKNLPAFHTHLLGRSMPSSAISIAPASAGRGLTHGGAPRASLRRTTRRLGQRHARPRHPSPRDPRRERAARGRPARQCRGSLQAWRRPQPSLPCRPRPPSGPGFALTPPR